MSEESITPPKKEPAKKEPAKKPAEPKMSSDPKFSHERLLAEAPAVLGYKRHVVAGALSEQSKKELTIQETKVAIEQFLSKKGRS